jgi:hypothetical protein
MRKTIVQIIIAAALLNPVLAHAGKKGTCIRDGVEILRHDKRSCQMSRGARWMSNERSASAEKLAAKNNSAAQSSRKKSDSYETRNSNKRAATSSSEP